MRNKSFDWLMEQFEVEGRRMASAGTNYSGGKFLIVPGIVGELNDDALVRAKGHFGRITMNNEALAAHQEICAEIERRNREERGNDRSLMRWTFYASVIAALAGIVAVITPFVRG